MDHGATQKQYQFGCLWNVSQRKVAGNYRDLCAGLQGRIWQFFSLNCALSYTTLYLKYQFPATFLNFTFGPVRIPNKLMNGYIKTIHKRYKHLGGGGGEICYSQIQWNYRY